MFFRGGVMAHENSHIITRDSTMLSLLEGLRRTASSDASVLLEGETGVGKELFAEYVHRHSPRKSGPLVKVELPALSPDLIESELFGHERGAFTGAIQERRGFFELASEGTLFLDDIDDFPLPLQPKLLRAIESREIYHLGGTRPIKLNIRLVVATKISLLARVRESAFRSDLYYRINEFAVPIPPLRERRCDIPLLAEAFFQRFAEQKDIRLAVDARDALVSYEWPGNVRELRNVVRRVSLNASGEVGRNDLPSEVLSEQFCAQNCLDCTRCWDESSVTFDQMVASVERTLLLHSLQVSAGNQLAAARRLSLQPSTFRDKLRKHGISAYVQGKNYDQPQDCSGHRPC